MRRLFLTTAALIFCVFVVSFAATIHVPSDQPTIQAGINAAVNGDTVLVASGTYYEHIDFDGKLITVISESSPALTTISINQSGLPVVTFDNSETSDSRLEGFTIHGDLSYWGIYINASSPTIYNNIITTHEVGIYVNNSSGLIRRNEIINCQHSDISPNNGGGIRLYGCNGAVVDSNSIHDNFADVSGGIHSQESSDITIERNLIYANSCTYVSGIKVDYGQNHLIRNNTVVGNTASSPIGAVLFYETDGIDIRNNIIAFNDEWGVYNWGASFDYTVDYNDIYGNASGDIYGVPVGPGNIFLDPQFIDANGHDYNLSAGSPCIDAGDPDSPLDPDGSTSDIGALYYGGGPGIYTLDIQEVFAEQGNPADISIIASGFSGQAIAGVEFHLLYDETCISFNEFSSVYLTDALVNVADNEIHILWEDYQNPVYIDEDAAILTLEFDVLADLGTECTITWQETSEIVDSIGDPISGVSYLPGSILSTTLRNMAGAVRYFNSSLPVGGTDLSLSGFLEGETMSDTGGLYAFQDYPPGEYAISASRTGDDPGVTVNDIVLIRRQIVELELFTSPYQMIAGDVNDNGVVSVADIIKIRRYLAELDDLPSGNWAFVDSAFAITFENWFEAPDYIDVTLGSDDITDLDFIGVRKGDVDYSWGSEFGSLICLDDSVSVSLNNVSCQPGENVTMPITATDFTDIAGVEIHAEYPQDAVEVISINSNVMEGATVNGGSGEIHFIWEDIDNLLTVADYTEIILIEFQVSQNAPDTIPLSFVLTYVCDEFGDNFIVVEYNGFIITGPTAIGDDDNLPTEYSLQQNFPNPFNANTTLAFKLPYQSHVNLTVYDIQGRVVELLLNEEMMAGTHQVVWNASDCPSGIYLYKLETENYSETRKMILLK